MSSRRISGHTRHRTAWLQLHRWFGATLGVMFTLAGLTGSLLVFYPAIDGWLNPELQIRHPLAGDIDWTRMLDRLRQVEPDRDGAWRIEVPIAPDQPVTARYYDPVERKDAHFSPLMLTLHPATGDVLTRRFWGDYGVTWIYDLHYTLLLGAPGKLLMAGIGLAMLATLVAGLVLWWPTLRKPGLALSLDFRPGTIRRNYHLHKAVGLYSSPVLLVLAFTGVLLAAPAWFEPVLRWAGMSNPPAPQSSVTDATDRVDVDRAMQAALGRFPGSRVRWIQTPAGETGTWLFRLEQTAEPGQRFPKTMVWVDQYSGIILAASDPLRAPAGERFLNWMHPLHSGEAFGLPGRITVALAGLLLPLLFFTGLRRWWQKRLRRRPAATPVPPR